MKNTLLKNKVVPRLIFLMSIALLCALGLWTRRQNGVSPNFFNTYFPDTAWTMAVYCGCGMLFNRGAKVSLPTALAISYLVEFSQCFHPLILEGMRATRLGGLILGYGFLWSDLVCYTIGAVLCTAAEEVVRKTIRKDRHIQEEAAQ